MNKKSIVVIGLPESGKTTFLAALWHVISAREIDSELRFHSLANSGDARHLHEIAARWREAKMQSRTSSAGIKMVCMNLVNRQGEVAEVTFPDVPGEEYSRMWEDRECAPETAELLSAQNVLLFVHSGKIRFPIWVTDVVEANRMFALPQPKPEDLVEWNPAFAPTQVQLVDMLQLLHRSPLDVGRRRIAVMLSAWDVAEVQKEEPELYIRNKFPLFAQYLRQNTDKWEWSLYGISAQGGKYDPVDEGKEPEPQAEELRNMENPTDRIRLRTQGENLNDITAPLAWLMNSNNE